MKLHKKFKIIFIIPILLLSFCGQGMKALLENGKITGIDPNDIVDVMEPRFNYSSGSYSHDLEVVIRSKTKGAQIFYTLDNSKPDINSNIYSGPIKIEGDGNGLIIKSVAYRNEIYSKETSVEYKINYTTPSTPQILIDGEPFAQNSDGYYTWDIEISLISSTPGSTIYYTTDGTTPTDESTQYTSVIKLTALIGTMSIKAITINTTLGESSIASATLTVDYETVETPWITPPGGTYTKQQKIKIFSETDGSQIIYTTDGSDPRTSSSAQHGNALTVKESMTIKAYALKNGMWDSDLITVEYIIITPSPPQILINNVLYNQDSNKNYTSDIDLTIVNSTPGTKIYYTTDGTTPSEESEEYTSAITFTGLAGSTTMKVVAISSTGKSPIVSVNFTVEYETVKLPAIKPPGGTFTSAQNVKISSETDGSQIFYTTDGSDPKDSPTAKNGNALRIKNSMTIRAYASKSGMNDSAETTVVFDITE